MKKMRAEGASKERERADVGRRIAKQTAFVVNMRKKSSSALWKQFY